MDKKQIIIEILKKYDIDYIPVDKIAHEYIRAYIEVKIIVENELPNSE